MSDSSKLQFIICQSVLCLLFVQFQPLSATAQEEADNCHVRIVAHEPQMARAEIYAPILFSYHVIFDEDCRLNVVLSDDNTRDCQQPQVEMRPGELTTVLEASISVDCVYLRPGHYYTPPLKIEVFPSETSMGEVHFPKLQPIVINNILEDEDSSEGMMNVLEFVPWRQHISGIWMVFFGLATILLISIGIGIGRNLMKNSAKEILPILPPIAVFRNEVADLVNVTPVTLEEYKCFHDRLSHAVKVYLKDRFGFEALSGTTDQIYRGLVAKSIPSEQCEKAKSLMQQSDYVRFAQDAPSQAENLYILMDMSNLIEKLESIMQTREQIAREREAAAVSVESGKEQTVSGVSNSHIEMSEDLFVPHATEAEPHQTVTPTPKE